MEKNDELLIAQHVDHDGELRKHVEEHANFEKMLEGFNRRVYLTPEEEMEKKRIQKMKLLGRDKIQQILSRYRTASIGSR